MDPYISLMWLLDGAQINTYPVIQCTLGQFTRLLPADPLRWMCFIPFIPTSAAQYAFSDSTPAVAQFQLPANTGLYKLTRLEVGQLITLPLWIYQNFGTPWVAGTAVSFLPEKYQRYLDHAQRQLP